MSTLSPRQARENERFPFDALLYHESVGSIFTAIPKSGCSSIKRWFIALTNPAALHDPALDVHKYAAAHFALSRMPRAEADLLLRGHPVIGVVRAPLDRLRAAFVDKFVRPRAEELMPAAQELIADAQSINQSIAVPIAASPSASLWHTSALPMRLTSMRTGDHNPRSCVPYSPRNLYRWTN